jgi:hypothetical protein
MAFWMQKAACSIKATLHASIEAALADIYAQRLPLVAARRKSADGALPPSAKLSVGDRSALQKALQKLAGELALIPGALGLS